MLQVTQEIALPDHDVEERFVPLPALRTQKRKREFSGVELRLDILAASLPEEVKTALLALHDRRVTRNGVLVVVSRAYTSQQENRDAARARLIDIVRSAATPPAARLRAARPRTPRPSRKTGRSVSALRRAVKAE
jgi:ribosome-associated protein